MDIENQEASEPTEPCWPFWGLLIEHEKPPAQFYDKKYECYVILNFKNRDFFSGFHEVVRECLTILQHRTPSELRGAAAILQEGIEDQQGWYVENETEKYIQDLSRDGGWELNYLPDGSSGSEYDIRKLLKNWSNAWDDPIRLPQEDDLPRVDALAECIENSWKRDGDLIYFGSFKFKYVELLALLSLMVICQSIHTISVENEYRYGKIPAEDLILIGNTTVETLRIYRLIELARLESQLKSANAAERSAIFEKEFARRKSEEAKRKADKGHAKRNEARDWVLIEWKLHHDVYYNNKSDFARIYSTRLKDEWSDHDGTPMRVTDRTIREMWLKNSESSQVKDFDRPIG